MIYLYDRGCPSRYWLLGIWRLRRSGETTSLQSSYMDLGSLYSLKTGESVFLERLVTGEFLEGSSDTLLEGDYSQILDKMEGRCVLYVSVTTAAGEKRTFPFLPCRGEGKFTSYPYLPSLASIDEIELSCLDEQSEQGEGTPIVTAAASRGFPWFR